MADSSRHTTNNCRTEQCTQTANEFCTLSQHTNAIFESYSLRLLLQLTWEDVGKSVLRSVVRLFGNLVGSHRIRAQGLERKQGVRPCMKTQLLTIETHLVLRLKALVPFVVHLLHVVAKSDGCDRLHAVGDCMNTRLGTSSTHCMCLQ